MSFNFHKLRVYQDMRMFRKDILAIVIPCIPENERYEINSQLRRALYSVLLNIAEGSYRTSNKDMCRFLNIAITSLYEVVSCLDILQDDRYIDGELLTEFTAKAEKIARQLSALINSLKKDK